MRIVLQEDFPGELDGATADEVEAKLAKAFGVVRGLLAKGTTREQGTVAALDELQEALAKSYDRRLEQMRRDVLKTVRGA